ncbi:MAG TPA: hypothetical protein VFM70_08970 [Salinimicrobium sp.]|nr:hypothetical protein [Salinimicrobium sp.]
MKKYIFFLLISILILGCKTNEYQSPNVSLENPETSFNENILNVPYLKYSDFEVFKDYEKIADTLIYAENIHPQFSLLQIKKTNDNIILFSQFSIDENEPLIENLDGYERKILDTLHIPNLKPNEIIISGCCELENKYGEEMIAVIEKTDGLVAEKINRAWKADIKTGQIEEVYDFEKLKCINKNYKIEISETDF